MIDNYKKINFSNDEVARRARRMIDEMPRWQREYCEEVVESAVNDSDLGLPRMLS